MVVARFNAAMTAGYTPEVLLYDHRAYRDRSMTNQPAHKVVRRLRDICGFECAGRSGSAPIIYDDSAVSTLRPTCSR